MRTVANHDRRTLNAASAGLLATVLVLVSIGPSAALPGAIGAPQANTIVADRGSDDVHFRRHFFRGQPGLHKEIDAHRNRAAYSIGPEDEAMLEQADRHGYCSARYKSYDPSTGEYLGYDGLYHVCG